jgi:hypothetical protein
MEGSDTVTFIVGVLVFASGVTVKEVIVSGVVSDVESEREIVILVGKVMVGKVMVGGVLLSESLDVESESEMVSKVEVSVIVVVSVSVS